MTTTDKKRQKVEKLTNEIKHYGLSTQHESMAILAGQAFGAILSSNFIGIYRDDTFEKYLTDQYTKKKHLPTPETIKQRVLHIISTPCRVGGHTRLVEKLVQSTQSTSDILITKPFSMDRKALRVTDTVNVIYQKREYTIEELARIISEYKTILLHINPDDLKASIAVSLARKYSTPKVIFVNHADHRFSFGFYSADIIAEISSFGTALTKKKRGGLSSFLGIPVEPINLPETHPDRNQSTLNIFSSGHGGKFKPFGRLSFPTLAKTILRSIPNSKLTIVGPSFKDTWWWLPRVLYPTRLKILPGAPYDQYITLINKADIYIDSTPISGGTTLPEMRARGIPVTGIITGALGYSPLDQTKFLKNDELISELKKLSLGKTNKITQTNNSTTLISDTRNNHNISNINKRLNDIIENNTIFHIPPPHIHCDLDFYEKQWSKDGLIHIDMSVLDFIFSLNGQPYRRILRAMYAAMSFTQIIALTLKYFRHKIKT